MNNARGSASVLVAIAVAVVGSFVAFHIATSYEAVNARHSAQKAYGHSARSIQRLAQLVKRAYIMNQLNPTCAGTGASHGGRERMHRVTVGSEGSRTSYCFSSRNICLSETEHGRTKHICASTRGNALDWQAGAATPAATFNRLPSSEQSNSRVQNRIVIPTRTDGTWKSCLPPAVCVRIALCEDNVLNCDLKDAVATQVIRID